jgi:hypothetical protein
MVAKIWGLEEKIRTTKAPSLPSSDRRKTLGDLGVVAVEISDLLG